MGDSVESVGENKVTVDLPKTVVDYIDAKANGRLPRESWLGRMANRDRMAIDDMMRAKRALAQDEVNRK